MHKKSEPLDSLLRRGGRIRTLLALPSTRDALTGLRYRYGHKKSEPYDSLLRRGGRIRTSMALPSTRDALTGLRYRYRHKKKRAT